MSNRRRFLQTALAAGALPAAASLSGCRALIDVLGDACPEDPAESGGIDWTPDVLHPVSFGSQEYTMADGAPQPMRVYYPSHETFSDTHRLLKLCLDRWPLVLFLHGLSPKLPCTVSNSPNYLRWRRIPTLLAKSGYVVAVPDYNAGVPEAGSPLIALMISIIDWLRTDWEHARWVDKRPSSVAVAGHSFGGLLAARVAQQRPDMGAYISLGSSFNQLSGARAVLNSLNLPSLFMWSNNFDLAPFEDLDHDKFWDDVPSPKHAMIHSGGHFDYVPPGLSCSDPRGECPAIESVAAELIALYLGRYMSQARAKSNIPVTLIPPIVPLTPKQQFYGGGQFTGLDVMKSEQGCRGVTLRWVEDGEAETRNLGP